MSRGKGQRRCSARPDYKRRHTFTRGITNPSINQKRNSWSNSRRLVISTSLGRCAKLRERDADAGRSHSQSATQNFWRSVCTVIDSKRRRRRKEVISASRIGQRRAAAPYPNDEQPTMSLALAFEPHSAVGITSRTTAWTYSSTCSSTAVSKRSSAPKGDAHLVRRADELGEAWFGFHRGLSCLRSMLDDERRM